MYAFVIRQYFDLSSTNVPPTMKPCPGRIVPPPSACHGRPCPPTELVSLMTNRTYPNISQLAARMSANHSRVVRSIDQMITPIDEMVQASADADWPRVAELGHQLANNSREAGYRGVSVMAQVVANEAGRPDNAHGVKRSLIRLIGTYGRTTRTASAD
jgi:hypothetical protein